MSSRTFIMNTSLNRGRHHPLSIGAHWLTLLLPVCLLAFPALAESRTLALTTQLRNYGGDGAYLAVYLTNADGALVDTLWVSGRNAKYHKHLSAWKRLSAGNAGRLDGVTGASVTAGGTLQVRAALPDTLIDSGHEIRVDVAAEDMRDSPAEIRLPLTSSGAGKPQAGKQYIQSLTYELQ